MDGTDAAIEQVVTYLRNSRSVLFITGAGMSADSGLPTYRGIGGLYNTGETEEGYPIETLLSGEMIKRRPELTWKYLAQIARACSGATYNRGHQVLAEMERHFDRAWTLTQNVDGFHRQAGSENVIDIHGDLHHLVCTQCAFRMSVEEYEEVQIPPICQQCSSIVRPDVVLFGEMLPADKLDRLRAQLQKGFDLVFTIGTTSVFPYISAPVEMAKSQGRPTVEINPDDSQVSGLVDVKLRLRAAEALDVIWQRYERLDLQ